MPVEIDWSHRFSDKCNLSTTTASCIYTLLRHLFPMLHFYAPWKHKRIVRFSRVFKGYRNVTLGTNGLYCQLMQNKSRKKNCSNVANCVSLKIHHNTSRNTSWYQIHLFGNSSKLFDIKLTENNKFEQNISH